MVEGAPLESVFRGNSNLQLSQQPPELDDPQFMVRIWQVPLNKPWDYNAAQNSAR